MLTKGTRLVLLALVVLTASLTLVEGAPSAAQEKLPASLERVTGNTAISYAFFTVLAGIAVLLIYRGIRAR
jgi:hypothetical protein